MKKAGLPAALLDATNGRVSDSASLQTHSDFEAWAENAAPGRPPRIVRAPGARGTVEVKVALTAEVGAMVVWYAYGVAR